MADFRPPGAHGRPREPWDGLRFENNEGCTKNQPRGPALRPVHGYFVFLVLGHPLNGAAPKGAERQKLKLVGFGRSKRPPASRKPIRKGGGPRPQPFLMGFPDAGGRFDIQNRSISVFILRLLRNSSLLRVPEAGLGRIRVRVQRYPMFRNSASGPEIRLPGRISAGC